MQNPKKSVTFFCLNLKFPKPEFFLHKRKLHMRRTGYAEFLDTKKQKLTETKTNVSGVR